MQQPSMIPPGHARLILDVSRLSTRDMEKLRQPPVKRIGYFLCQRRPLALIWEGSEHTINEQAEALWGHQVAARVIACAEEEQMFIRELVLRYRRERVGAA